MELCESIIQIPQIDNEFFVDLEFFLNEDHLNKWEKLFQSYLLTNYDPEGTSSIIESLIPQFEELGIEITHPFEDLLPEIDNIEKADVGEASASFILGNCCKLDFPVLPWSKKLSGKKALEGIDLVGIKRNDSNDLLQLIIIEAKASSSLNGISAHISAARSKFISLGTEGVIKDLRLYQRLFSADFSKVDLYKALGKHATGCSTLKILGWFVGPSEFDLSKHGKKFNNLGIKIHSIRYFFKYQELEKSLKRLFQGVENE